MLPMLRPPKSVNVIELPLVSTCQMQLVEVTLPENVTPALAVTLPIEGVLSANVSVVPEPVAAVK